MIVCGPENTQVFCRCRVGGTCKKQCRNRQVVEFEVKGLSNAIWAFAVLSMQAARSRCCRSACVRVLVLESSAVSQCGSGYIWDLPDRTSRSCSTSLKRCCKKFGSKGLCELCSYSRTAMLQLALLSITALGTPGAAQRDPRKSRFAWAGVGASGFRAKALCR